MSLVRFRPEAPYADLAHLVERRLAKAKVAGSSPVIRSKVVGAMRPFLVTNIPQMEYDNIVGET